jgi:ABC-2 type transport system permease protein
VSGVDPTRVRRLLRKELRQIFRDPRMKRIIFVAPIFQLIVFGYAVNTDIRDTPMFVVDHSATLRVPPARGRPHGVGLLPGGGPLRAARAPWPGRWTGATPSSAWRSRPLRPRPAAGRGAAVQVLVDGTNSNTATVVQGNVLRIIQQEAERQLAAGQGTLPRGVELRIRAWFNPDLASRVYNVPAVMGLIVLIMACCSPPSPLVREREMGTLEQLMVTPVTPGELILGKTLPVALIALTQLALIMAVAIFWFGIPFRGSILALLAAAAIYIVAGLAFGLLISTVSRTQQEAIMVMFLFFMPAIVLSGFMFPVFTMPPSSSGSPWPTPSATSWRSSAPSSSRAPASPSSGPSTSGSSPSPPAPSCSRAGGSREPEPELRAPNS